MMTHPDFVLQATKDRQERVNADVSALRVHEASVEPGKVRRTLGDALIHLGERVGGRATRQPGWPPAHHGTIRLV